MEFIKIDKLLNVYEKEQVQNDFGVVYRHFLHCENEVIYIIEDNAIYGVVSIGDVIRFLQCGDKSLLINTDFAFLKDADEASAKQMFGNLPSTIYEIPVICEGNLLGVMKKGKKESDEWIGIRKELKREYHFSWHRKMVNNFLEQIKGSIFFYGVETYDFRSILFRQQDKSLRERAKGISGDLSGVKKMTLKEREAFFEGGEKEWVEYCECYEKIRFSRSNGIMRPQDLKSKLINYQNGYRVFLEEKNNNSSKRKVYFFGPCIINGSYVTDIQTIEYYLQQVLIENHYNNYEIMNCGMPSFQHVWSRVISEPISEDDIIIIADDIRMFGPGYYLMKHRDRYYGDIMDTCWEIDNFAENMLDSCIHVNYKVNKKIAERIFEDIKGTLRSDSGRKEPVAVQDYYISYDVIEYFNDYFWKYQLEKRNKLTGAIVMNCNPFTKGHRYLIEKAAEAVELLYVFVVEEDKSVFKFQDRMAMVCEGTKDLDNVKVVPSGKYILSSETFGQYFQKDVVEEIEDMSYDLRIFGEVVAKELGITYRFVGEEPFDKVTRQYNETMKRILGEYNIKVVEIPRLKTKENAIIGASKVREVMRKKEIYLLHDMLPESTIKYLATTSWFK